MPTLPELALILFVVVWVFGYNTVAKGGEALGRAVGRLFEKK